MVSQEEADKNYKWFQENLPELAKKYEGLYVVIKRQEVKGAYKTIQEAWEETLKTNKAGTFIIQLCSMDDEKTSYTFFTNRVSFD